MALSAGIKEDNYNSFFGVDSLIAKRVRVEVILDNCTFIAFGKESNTKALVVEGNLEAKVELKDIKELVNSFLIYSKTRKPTINVEGKVRNLVVFVSSSRSAKENGVFVLKNCKNRLLIEPIEMNISVTCEWNFREDKLCTMIAKYSIEVNQLIITLTFQDVYFVIGILQQQLKHIMNDYIEKSYRYYFLQMRNENYSAQIDKQYLNQNIPKVRKITDDFTPLKNMSDIIKETLTLFNSFKEDMQKLRQLNRRIIVIKKDNNLQVSKYELAEITKHDVTLVVEVKNDIKGIYINDIFGMFYPLFEIEITHPIFYLSQDEKHNISAEFKGKTVGNYYHCAASAWEPLWEPFRIECTFESNANEEQNVTKLLFPDNININITDTLILLIRDNIELWNSKDNKETSSRNLFIRKGRKNDNILDPKSILNSEYDSITEFIIKNLTGVIFYITVKESIDVQKQLILPDETVNLLIDPSEALAKIKQLGRNNLHIRIDFDEETGIPPIERINLNCVKDFTHAYTINGKKHYFICSTKIEQMRKVFSIGTPLSITNELNMPVILSFEILAKDSVEYKLEPGVEFSIPVKLMQETARVFIANAESSTLSKFDFKQLTKLFDTHKAVQITISKGMHGVFTLKRNPMMNALNFSLLPPYNFINCLAVKVKLKFLSTCTKIKLEPGKSSFVYTSNITGSLLLNIFLPHFVRQEIKFKYNSDLLDIPIELKDKSGNKVTIYMRVITNTTARYTIILYSKAYIVNWSKQNFAYYYRNEDEGEIPIAGQYMEDKSITLLNKHPSFVCYFEDFYSSIPISYSSFTIHL